MASWRYTEIEFLEPRPSTQQVNALTDLLRGLDSDTPPIGDHGMRSEWRSPSLSVKAVCDLLHHYGSPCRGRQWPDDVDRTIIPDLAWHMSQPDLSVHDDLTSVAWNGAPSVIMQAYVDALRLGLAPLPECEIRPPTL